MPELSIIQQIVIWIIPVLSAITLHEAAHAFVAYKLGDTTAKLLGRLSLNPLKHAELMGTFIVPVTIMILSQFSFVFGWAKPVPINTAMFKNPRRDIILTTAAGPLSNILMAILWALCNKFAMVFLSHTSMATLFIVLSAQAGIIINLVLAFLNLIPIPPLDGSKILANCLPPKQALLFEKIEPFGFLILLILIFTGALNWIIGAPINWAVRLLTNLFGL